MDVAWSLSSQWTACDVTCGTGKLTENNSVHDKVMVWTRKDQLKCISYHCDLDLESTDFIFAFGTSS